MPAFGTAARIILLFATVAAIPIVARADCSDAESTADDSYTYARRALHELDFDSAQSLMWQARDAAEEAQSEAEECGCDDAASYADDAYTNAHRAYNASNLRELRHYAIRAMKAAEKIRNATSLCD